MKNSRQRIAWMKNRLFSMEPAELPFRLREWWRIKKSKSWQPSSLPDDIFHSPVPVWPFIPDEIPQSIHDSAEEILTEGVRLLGEHWSVEQLWKWGWDPNSGTYWPQIHSHEIELRFADSDIKPAWELLKLQHLQVLAWSAKGGNLAARDKCLEGLKSWLD